MILDDEGNELILPKREMIPRDFFKKGDNIILSAFGGGFTWGAVYLKWAYNS